MTLLQTCLVDCFRATDLVLTHRLTESFWSNLFCSYLAVNQGYLLLFLMLFLSCYLVCSHAGARIKTRFAFVSNLPGVINITYTTVPGFLKLRNQTEGTLAEPGVDYIPVSGSLLLGEGETSAAINITILEVNFNPFHQYTVEWKHNLVPVSTSCL